MNLPGPVAAARLATLGASITKVEPPTGDPLRLVAADYYQALASGQDVIMLDLRAEDARTRLWDLLGHTDLLLTSTRPSALARLGLDWASLHQRLPQLCQVAIVGKRGAGAEQSGHDLTYQASAGTLLPPAMPTVLVADLAGAERAVADALATLVLRGVTGSGGYRETALSEVAEALAQPVSYGLTSTGGVLGGGLPAYGIYPAASGHVALAALEAHFWTRLTELLGVRGGRAELERTFATRTAQEWQDWALEHDVPLVAVHPALPR